MSDVVEPGHRLVERYRLDERLGSSGHGPAPSPDADVDGAVYLNSAVDLDTDAEVITYWRAHDELLDRAVGICLLHTADDHAGHVLRAARKAAVLTDSRFLRVLDASEVDGMVYVVSEWVSATNLVDLLAAGPLPPEEARVLTAEVAEALGAAHEAGLAHLCLAPEHVLRTSHGQVKLAGLGVDAAARGITVPTPAEGVLHDTRAAAGLLYACLTARWPGSGASTLPAAPRDGDDLCSPRQVRAGVPDDLDGIACRGLGITGGRSGAPIRTPDELQSELATAHRTAQRTTRLPIPAPTLRPAAEPVPAYVAVYDDQGPARRGVRPAALVWTLVGLLLLAGIGLALSQLLAPGGRAQNEPTASSPSPSTTTAQSRAVKVAGTTTLDPPPGNGEENSYVAPRAVDGDPSTAWNTKTYLDPFPRPQGIKDGVGLVLDLGQVRQVTAVTVSVLGGATGLEVRTARRLGKELSDFRPLAAAGVVADPAAEVRSREAVKARYVLIWLTSLPEVSAGTDDDDGTELVADGQGQYRGQVAEVEVRATDD